MTSFENFKTKFHSSLIDEINFLGETTFQVKKESIKESLRYFKEEEGFDVLMDLTAVDYLVPSVRTKVVYLLHHSKNYSRVRLTVYLNRKEEIESVTSLWAGADWYEREVFDLYGVHFFGHPDMKRILMPDDWIGHPLLKDYSLGEVPVEFKNNVKPKVPSEIIPYVK